MPEFWVGMGAILPELGGSKTGPSGEDMEAGRGCEGCECVVAGGGIATGCAELEVGPRTSGEVLLPRCL